MNKHINIVTTLAALVFCCHVMTFAQSERRQNTNATRKAQPQTTQTSAPTSSPGARPPAADRAAATVTLLPDLVIAQFKNCKDEKSGSADGCFKFQIKNQGLGDAGGITLRVVFKVRHGFSNSSPILTVVKLVTVPALARGHEVWVTVPGGDVQSPSCIDCIPLNFVAQLDPKSEIKESNKENNRLLKELYGSGTKVSGTKDDANNGDPEASHVPSDYYQWIGADYEKYEVSNYRLIRVEAGKHVDGTMMYVCQGYMSNGDHPGKLYQDKCYVPWNGKEYVLEKKETGLLDHTNYAVLLTPYSYYRWVPVSQLSLSDIKKWAVVGGYVKENTSSENLYICRMKLNDGSHAGKFLLSTGTCYVAWSGKELTSTSGFEVLKGL